jgi:hypothetical protein
VKATLSFSKNLFVVNMKFKSGVIGRVLRLYDIIEPDEPMMKISLYGDKMNVMSTNMGGALVLIWNDIEYKHPSIMKFPPERGIDVYGLPRTTVR